MKFKFYEGTNVNTEEWTKINGKLEADLAELASGKVPEYEILMYLMDMTKVLRSVKHGDGNEMLFLAYDEPNSMPSDARTDFVYKPTYIAATIMMTAVIRFPKLLENEAVRRTVSLVLNAATGRNFLGAGFNSYSGLLDTLEIFAKGDVVKFVENHPGISERFTSQFLTAVDFLKDEICTGNVKDAWSGEDYIERGCRLLKMLSE